MPLYKFYRIVHKTQIDTECYIGCTIQPLHKRFHGHCTSMGCSSRQLIEKYGKDNLQIVLIHELELPNRMEARREERRLIEETEKKVNQARPYVSVEQKEIEKRGYLREYRLKNKERAREYFREYHLKNKERKREVYRKYYEANREKIIERTLKRHHHKKVSTPAPIPDVSEQVI